MLFMQIYLETLNRIRLILYFFVLHLSIFLKYKTVLTNEEIKILIIKLCGLKLLSKSYHKKNYCSIEKSLLHLLLSLSFVYIHYVAQLQMLAYFRTPYSPFFYLEFKHKIIILGKLLQSTRRECCRGGC